MALETHSKIYYNYKVTTENRYLDINDGTDNVTISLDLGSYSPTDLATHISSKLNELALGDWTVSFNRTDRKFTITSTNTYSILFSTGINNDLSCASMLGFNATDLTGANNYTSQNSSGSVYATQFYIQSYKPTSQNRRAIDGVVNKSASGKVEVVKFGNERFLEGELLFITDIIQASNSVVRTNVNGVSDYINLIEWLTEKAPVEIMIDENKPDEFQTFILESTDQDTKGLDYELIELYDRQLPLYYRSGRLKFKLLE